MNIITKIKQWFDVVGNLTKEKAKLEAYVKSLESGGVITALKDELAKLEGDAKADVVRLEGVLDGWRQHALSLEKQLAEKI